MRRAFAATKSLLFWLTRTWIGNGMEVMPRRVASHTRSARPKVKKTELPVMRREPRLKRRLFHLVAAASLGLSVACFALQYRGATVELMRRGGPGPTVV